MTLARFMDAYEKVRQPFGDTIRGILNAIDLTAELPSGLAELGYGNTCNKLVRICKALREHEGERAFFLSARMAGELIGVHFTDAATMLKMLVRDGVIALVTRDGTKTSPRQASRYRYVWCPCAGDQSMSADMQAIEPAVSP